MKPRSNSSTPDSPTTPAAFARWLRSWRYFFALLVLAVLVLLFYAEENWRGRRSWEKYQQALQARGVSVSRDAVVPQPVPDEQNFTMTPALASLFDFVPGTQTWRYTNALTNLRNVLPEFDAAMTSIGNRKPTSTNSWAKPIDLVQWYEALAPGTNRADRHQKKAMIPGVTETQAASGVLAALAESDPLFDELRAASRRPYARFNIRYEEENPAGILLPHLSVVKQFCQFLQVRAIAELALDRTDAAAQDLSLMLYLTGVCRNEPIIISQLVRMAQLQIVLATIAQGLNQWTDPQLASFDDQLRGFDFLLDARRALQAERVFFGTAIIDYVRRSPDRLEMLESGSSNDGSSGAELVGILFHLAPSGWFDLEKINHSRMFDDYLLPIISVEKREIRPSTCQREQQQITKLFNHSWGNALLRHRYFSRIMLPDITRFSEKTAFAQTGVDIGSVVCALQRYHLAQGRFPDKLDLLAPRWLAQIPRDVINGDALKYQLTTDGRFLLYSIGWNERDDGGVAGTLNGLDIARNRNGNEGEPPPGDWVWR